MKANEFVKKHGLSEARIALAYCNAVTGGDVFYKNIGINVSEFKCLVESHELIESCGGLEQAKAYAIDANACGAFNDERKLKQAILDVESCQ